jgi:uncharacterized RDD family membrane protein YckC
LGLDVILLYALTLLCVITVIGIIALPFLWLGYFPFYWSRSGATPGDKACGLRVVREADGGPLDTGTAIIRFVVVFLELLGSAFLIGLLGFIWAAFEPRKRAWHDMAAGTVVIHAQLYPR